MDLISLLIVIFLVLMLFGVVNVPRQTMIILVVVLVLLYLFDGYHGGWVPLPWGNHPCRA